MGRGNVCVSGKYEGLYFIDNDDLHIYRPLEGNDDEPKLLKYISLEELSLWEYSDIDTQWWEYDVIVELQNSMQKKVSQLYPLQRMDQRRTESYPSEPAVLYCTGRQ